MTLFRTRRRSVFLSDVLKRYIEQRDLSKDYSMQLTRRIEHLQKWHGKPIRVSNLSTDLVNRWLAYLQETGLVAETVSGYRRCLLSVWYAAADEALCAPPISRRIRKVKIRRAPPRAWTHEQVTSLLAAANRLSGQTPSGIANRLFWPAMFATAYDSGLRRGDLLRLKRTDISDAGVVTITQHKTNHIHVTGVWASTIALIDATFPPHRELVFPWPYALTTFGRYVKFIVMAAGLEGTLKQLRRTSGSYVEALHGGGGKHLGHRSTEVFDMCYNDPRISRASVPLPPELGGLR